MRTKQHDTKPVGQENTQIKKKIWRQKKIKTKQKPPNSSCGPTLK